MVPLEVSPINDLFSLKYDEDSVRSFYWNGVVWFIAQDICKILGIENPWNAVARLSSYMKGLHTVETLGGKQEMLVVNEHGIYMLALTSRKPNAQKFQEWLCTEVIPSIRR